jgi:hypothetical protein
VSIFRAPVSGFVTPLSQGDDRRLGKRGKKVFVVRAAFTPFRGAWSSGEAGTIHLAAIF